MKPAARRMWRIGGRRRESIRRSVDMLEREEGQGGWMAVSNVGGAAAEEACVTVACQCVSF